MLTIQTQETQVQVRCRSVAVAGSRHGSVDPLVADQLVDALKSLGFSFLVGCAPGVDACFRDSLTRHGSPNTIVACAFPSRERSISSDRLCAVTVVPAGLSPSAALHRRTVWLIRRASLLVLFPTHPHSDRWGNGSTLAFNTALYNLKPVFVVTDERPDPVPSFLVVASSLCDVVSGFWVLPYPEQQGGVCGDEW